MNKILGMDSAYDEAVEARGRNIFISANLVSEMIDHIRQVELDLGLVKIEAENTTALLKSCEDALGVSYSDNCKTVETVPPSPLDHAILLALYLENNIGSKYSCLSDALADFIKEME